MNTRQNQITAQFLRWTVGLVVFWESYQFASSAAARSHLLQMGLPHWVAPALGGAEMVAVIFFLIPELDRIGGYSLLAISPSRRPSMSSTGSSKSDHCWSMQRLYGRAYRSANESELLYD